MASSAPPEALLRLAIDVIDRYAVVTLDPAGIVTFWNRGAERLLGHPRERAIGQHISTVFPDIDSDDAILAKFEHSDSGGAAFPSRVHARVKTVEGAGLTVTAVHGDSGCIGYVIVGHDISVPAVARNLSTRAQLSARVEDGSGKLSESNALLSTEIEVHTHTKAARLRLLSRLIVAEEEERRRLAANLHDDLGQRLTALRLTLEAAGGVANGDPESSKSLATAMTMLKQIDERLDFLAWELTPAALEELELPQVLDNYIREWSLYTGVPAVFHSRVRDSTRLSPEIESSVYRIAQEALNNVAKHAHARSVNVLLEQRDQSLVLAIEDDGIGLPPGDVEETMMGLTGMRERVDAIGGTLDLEPTPDGGTTVLAAIPMSLASSTALTGVVFDDYTATPATEPPAAEKGGGSATVASLRAHLQELQRAVEARDDFIATVAHELRNPVAPLMFQIRLSIDKLDQMTASGEPVSAVWAQGQLRRTEQRLHRLLATLDRLLDVSRLATGRIDLQPEPLHLGLIVREVAHTFEAELGIARCTLTIVEHHEATGQWDRMRLEQICQNLLSNAIRFGAGRPIVVSVAAADGEHAMLTVQDQGVGISADLHTRIFERFERGVERRSGGFGIGLWVVRNICAAMGGSITVESELGEGARFIVVLPRGQTPGPTTNRLERQ